MYLVYLSFMSSSSKLQPNPHPPHHLSVIVPFRNRLEELMQFIPHIHSFLTRQGVSHTIRVIHQTDHDHRFNRAALINVGFILSQRDGKTDYVAMHDVDLLPLNDDLKYSFPGDGSALHLSSPTLHPKYHYDNFVGGILIMTMKDFVLLNGMSNRYWGWGLEDDEFFVRMKDEGIRVVRPEGIKTGIKDSFLHVHHPNHRRDQAKLFNQREVSRKRDRITGVHNVQYHLRQERRMTIDSAPFVMYDVELVCDIKQTPWCVNKSKVNETRQLLLKL